MTPAEIIYQRRIAVLDHAQRTGNVAETCRVFGISRTRYYEWKKRGRPLRTRGALMPKGRRTAPDARGHPHPCRRAPADPGRARAHHRLSPVRRPARRPGLLDRQVDGAEAPGRPRPGPAAPAPGPGGGHYGGHDRAGDRRGPRRRAVRVLPGHAAAPASWSAWTASTSASSRAWARCTSSPPSTSSPAGPYVAIVLGTPNGAPHGPLHRPGSCATIAATG